VSASQVRSAYDADLVILGGGCAGLSLGVRLAHEAELSRRTIILERRKSYSNDRTWCFWRGAAHPFEHLISHAWPTMRVQARPAQVVVGCGSTPYQLLAAGAFYQYAEEQIAAAPNVELRLDAAIREEPLRIPGGWIVQTDRGSVRARQIIDTRPPRHESAGDALLWQSFVGDEIECAVPVFDPSMVELMDFEAPNDNGIAFTYVLPTSPTRALVEYTVFGRRPQSVASLAGAQCAAVVTASRGNPVVVLRRESGILPMGLMVDPPQPAADYVRAGLMSGAGRASTGYAFQRIQRWAESAVASLRRGEFAVEHMPDKWHQRAMDRLFLHVLRDHPERAPDLFLSMFRGADASRVIRFLSDRGSAMDCAAIIATLPVGLFLRQLMRSGLSETPVLRGST
jgi:lycopene beta-cyclase